MSSNLYWEPAERKQHPLDTSLKMILRKMYGDLQGVELDEADLSSLRALVAADVSGAAILIEAIEKHGTVVLREVY